MYNEQYVPFFKKIYVVFQQELRYRFFGKSVLHVARLLFLPWRLARGDASTERWKLNASSAL
jgi:hypothetical protein